MRNVNRKIKASQPNFSQVGFTLVELLIVIVIIGILAGVVIGVLNPVQQQNRARDASVRSQLDKIALSTKSLFVSSPRLNNRAPTLNEFIGGISSVNAEVCTSDADADLTTGPAECSFTLQGITFPSDCEADVYKRDPSGGSSNACAFGYWRDTDEFRIASPGFATPLRMFVYRYLEDTTDGSTYESFLTCDVNWDIDAGVGVLAQNPDPGACEVLQLN